MIRRLFYVLFVSNVVVGKIVEGEDIKKGDMYLGRNHLFEIEFEQADGVEVNYIKKNYPYRKFLKKI